MATIQEPTEPRSRLSAGTLVLVVFGLIVLVVLLIGVAVYAMWRRQVGLDIQAELARIRQAGEPTTSEELAVFYASTPEATATASAWLAATRPLREPAFAALMKEIADDRTRVSDILSSENPWPVQSKAEQAVRQYANSLEQLYTAAERGGVGRYPVDLTPGFLISPSHFQDLRCGCRLLQWDAYLRARQGDAVGTARAIRALLMLARSMDAEPAIVSNLSRVAYGAIGNRHLLDALPAVRFSSQDLQRLQKAVRAQDYEGSLYRALVGDRVYGLHVMDDPASFKSDPTLQEVATRAKKGNRDLDRRCYLHFLGQLVAATQQPWPDAFKADAAVRREAVGLKFQNESFLTKDRYIITDTILPATQTLFAVTAREIAMRHVAEAAIALELYRREHGRLPGELSVLVPEYLPHMPQDPFNGEPLRYGVEGDGYLLYSVGENRVDDGGVLEKKDDTTAFSPDIGIRMSGERPAVSQ
jgi:hypothetical protein